MQKAFIRRFWKNKPSNETPLNETNLNNLEAGIDEIDNRVITLNLTKFDKTSAGGLMTSFELNTETGIITLGFYNGSKKTINTNLAKIALNITYDAKNERLVLDMPDGTKTYVDMKALITQYEFMDSDIIYFEVTADGKVKAGIKDGSITADKLQPNFLADVTAQANIATQKAQEAAGSAAEALFYVGQAESFAEKAEQAAATAGWGAFGIDEKGHLIFYKTENNLVDFRLNNGRLEAVI